MYSTDLIDIYESKDVNAEPSSYNFLNNLNLESDVTRRLTIHLNRIKAGSSEVYLTPLGKDNDPQTILKNWDLKFEAGKGKMNKVLLDLELSNRAKSGPRSIAVNWDARREGVMNYFKVDDSSADYDQLFTESEGNPSGSLRPISVEQGIKYLKNSTNSGLPFYTKKGKIKDILFREFDKLLLRKDPCILFTRTVEDLKTRTVWGYPVADTLNEMLYYRPLLDLQKKSSYRSAIISPERVDERMTKLIDKAIATNLSLVSIDFESYDASVKRRAQKAAFNYIKSKFQKAYHDNIDYIFERFNNIGLLTPDGILIGGNGIPSGSTFTNEVGSIFQYLVAKASKMVNLDDIEIQGDDGAYALIEEYVEGFFKQFESYGLKVNRSKSYVSKDYLIYLQKLHHNDYRVNGLCGGIYPVYRALNRILYQERWSEFEEFDLKGVDYYSIRTISILENCKYHPLFKEFVQFVYELDKYNLQYSRKSIQKYSGMIQKTQGLEDILKHQYGDNVSGIESFETVKILRMLA